MTREQACKIIVQCLYELSADVPVVQAEVFDDEEYRIESLPNGSNISQRYILDKVDFDETNQIKYTFHISDDYEYAIETTGDISSATELWGRLYCENTGTVSENISFTGNNHVLIVFKGAGDYQLRLRRTGTDDVGLRIMRTGMSELEFTKSDDSSFLYVNNPEYISKWDIVDDSQTEYRKIYEQKNITGKNTYYQTHLAWYNSINDATYYPTQDSFYSGVDFYNPNDYCVKINVSKLVYTNNKTLISNYVNDSGENFTITIPSRKHAQLFDYTDNKMINYKAEYLGIFILFDFEVIKADGGQVPFGEGITVSALAAYDYENMRLEDGQENKLLYVDNMINSGAMIYGDDRSKVERDIHIKYKGIAQNQSNQIDANIDFVISDDTEGSVQMLLKDNEMLKDYHPNTQVDWNVQINPLNDENVAILHTTPDNLHKFTYHFDENKQWYFDYAHRDTRMLTIGDDTTDSINQSVPEDIINKAKNDIINGEKSVDGSLDEYALEMGSWGVVYHYTITVRHTGTEPKTVKFRIKPKAHYTSVGKKSKGEDKYTFKDNGLNLEYQIPFEEEIEPGENVFEIVTFQGLGNGGLENTLIVE